MAVKRHMCLMILFLFLTGTSGAEDTHVFFSSGENVRLPCNNALSGCTSTTWNYNRHSETVELVAGGKLKTDIKRRERLSVGSDCSLNFKKVTKEDYGSYSCRQYVNGQQYGTDANVFLQALHVSSSPSQTEIRAGRTVTLYCQLDLYASTCGVLVNYEGYQLMWVNQAGENLMTDSRYQISDVFSSRCMITLTTTLLKEDHNREWRCQLTQRNQLKTSASFTVKYSGQTEAKTQTPVGSSETTVKTPVTSSQPVSPSVIAVAVVFTVLFVLMIVIVLWMRCQRRADNAKETNEPWVTDTNTSYKGTINVSSHPSPNINEQKDDANYSEVVTYCKLQANKVNDTVTYSSIRGEKAKAQENCSELYASVNKIRH